MSIIDSIRHGYARYRLRYPIYFFHHLPKCGGTSVREALENWFHVNDDHTLEGESEQPPIDLAELNSHNCISGHFGHEGHYIDQRYPKVFTGYRAAKRYRVFTFLRDPLEMRCSLYRHDVKLGRQQYPNLAAAIQPFNNYYSRILRVNESNWREKLDQYFFVGDADQLQMSFDILSQLINRPPVSLPKTNTTKVDLQSSVDSLTPTQVANFRAQNSLDYLMYQYVKGNLQSHHQ